MQIRLSDRLDENKYYDMYVVTGRVLEVFRNVFDDLE